MYEKSSHYKAVSGGVSPGCVVCHSNHGIHLPSTHAGHGSGQRRTGCHAPGDKCDRSRAAILSNLTQLDVAIKDADQSLRLAESSGMEVSESRLGQDQALDSLTEARVTIHTFQPALVDQEIQAGLSALNAGM